MSVSFSELGLSPAVMQAIADQGYTQPSPIQQEAIGPVLSQKDVMAAAQTGTGKTGAFALPIVHLLSESAHRASPNQVKALILTPTRELAAQVAESVAACHQHTSLRSGVVFGGVSINPQMKQLRRGCDILVATPGRLLDLFQQNAVKFSELEILVLDEADRMLDMGFIHDIKRIMKLIPAKRQTLLFSATFSDDIRQLAKQFTNNPVEVSVTPKNSTAPSVEQAIVHVQKSNKTALLIKLIQENKWEQVLVFSRTKHGANRIAKKLETQGIKAAAIHGNKSQGARTKALAEFKSNDLNVLVATDIAARGIDIDRLPNVINFDLPHVPEDYVHRIGRTGRAGATGHAVSFVTDEDTKQLKDIQNLIGKHIDVLEVKGLSVSGIAQAALKAPKDKRPKKPRRTSSGNGNSNSAGGNQSGEKRHANRANPDKPNPTRTRRQRTKKPSE
ncbi:MAG: DEAD/DEAH box helicase [Glaciecola sp.]|jgi:ATP-dependent RNA helicase RhlE|nr:ATP-dependent RNA helicase RhlE [Glaciecola sp.]